MPCRVARRLGHALGLRGGFLLLYSIIWTAVGYAQITSPQPDLRGLRPLLNLMPLDVWGWLWVASGLAAAAAAWLPQGRDWPGFFALPLIAFPWVGSYLYTWIAGDFPRGWVAAAVWAALAGAPVLVAGLREPPRPKRVEGYP